MVRRKKKKKERERRGGKKGCDVVCNLTSVPLLPIAVFLIIYMHGSLGIPKDNNPLSSTMRN